WQGEALAQLRGGHRGPPPALLDQLPELLVLHERHVLQVVVLQAHQERDGFAVLGEQHALVLGQLQVFGQRRAGVADAYHFHTSPPLSSGSVPSRSAARSWAVVRRPLCTTARTTTRWAASSTS